MKKIIALILAFVIAAAFAGCASKADTNKADGTEGDTASTSASADGGSTEYSTQAAAYKSSGKSSGNSFETVLDTNEYAMYYNIFYNDQGAEYDGKPVFKKGTFATLYDEYSGITRYYVWGYNDQTKCCDWQWELKPDEIKDIPANGSLVEVTGTFKKCETKDRTSPEACAKAALDGYWIINPEIKVKSEYTPADVDIDMSTMSATLERVQAFYIINKYETLEGKTVRMYARVLSDTQVQHPYYNGTDFVVDVETDGKMPAIGMMVMIEGTVKDGKITNAKVEITEDY